jgi:tetratricopeptide (TPR) repeat protein
MASRVIDLQTAVYEIHSAYENLDHGGPFFVIAGAGLSSPIVPTASEIVAHCKAKTLSHASEAPSESAALDEYSYWFDRAYPQPLDRQRYLRGLIQNKPITDSCLRLAHILASKRLANLFVTPNFDDFVSRALDVFGVSHVVCDHPETVDRIDLTSSEIKVVHAHGSYKYYDCRNLREELEHRARPSAGTVRTMAAFLDRALSFSSPLVIGYSGWQGDVIMAALRRRLEGASLPYRLYWFCHDHEALRQIQLRAPWLTEHADVRLVAPTQTTQALSVDARLSSEQPVLPARLVLEEVTRRFDIDEPEITRDPVGFVARQMKHALVSQSGSEDSTGIYSFASVADRFQRAAELEAEDFRIRTGADAAAGIDGFRTLLRKSQYSRALNSIPLLLRVANESEKRQLFDLVASLEGHELYPEDGLKAADALVLLSPCFPDIANAPTYRKRRLQWLQDRVQALYRLGRFAEAIGGLDQIACEFSENKEPEIVEEVLYAQTRKALCLSEIGNVAEAIAIYDEVLPKLKERPSQRRWAIQSEYNRAIFMRKSGRDDEAIVAFEQFAGAYRTVTDPFTQVLVINADSARASLIATQGDVPRAISILSQSVDEYCKVGYHSQVRDAIFGSLVQLVELQRKMRDFGNALAALEKAGSLPNEWLSSGMAEHIQSLLSAILRDQYETPST